MSRVRKGSNPIYKVGIPLITFMFGGLYFVTNFMETHMEIKDKRNKSTSERKFNLESEHKNMLNRLKIDEYKLSRIPRKDEDDEEERRRLKEKRSKNKPQLLAKMFEGEQDTKRP